MTSCLVVGMRDGSEKLIPGAPGELEELLAKLQGAVAAGRRKLVTHHLPGEGVMILTSWVSSVRLVKAVN